MVVEKKVPLGICGVPKAVNSWDFIRAQNISFLRGTVHQFERRTPAYRLMHVRRGRPANTASRMAS